MRLISATVRNYRVHRELSVEFDPARTLIAGPNESGKSTLVEAIHSALFVKATVTGKPREVMQSNRYPGSPEVEVVFEVGGKTYRVHKRYAGQAGRVLLAESGGSTWHGDEADARLAELLGVETPAKRTSAERVREQWAHLWVWQGRSTRNPAEEAQAQSSELVRQLQRVGGAVAMQSERDARVAGHFSSLYDALFTSRGKAKKDSDLHEAEEAKELAQARKADALARVERLRQAAADLERAKSTVARVQAELARLDAERQQVVASLAEASRLMDQEGQKQRILAQVKEEIDRVTAVGATIAGLQAEHANLKAQLLPKQEEIKRLEERVADLRRRVQEAERAYDQAESLRRQADLRKDLALAWRERYDAQSRYEELTALESRVRDLREQLEGVHKVIAGLPPVDQVALETLQARERRLAEMQAALRSMSAEIELVASALPVFVAGEQLAAGERRTVSELTEVIVGDCVRLNVYPGGEDRLSVVRHDLRREQAELEKELARLGVSSLSHAAQVAAQLSELKSKEESLRTVLQELDPGDELADSVLQATDRLSAAVADLERKLEHCPNASSPRDVREAVGMLEDALAELRGVERTVELARAEWTQLRDEQGRAAEALKTAHTEVTGIQQRLDQVQAQMELLLSEHGDDEARTARLSDLHKSEAEVERDLLQVQRELAALQPSALEADRDRLERAKRELEDERLEAEKAMAASRQVLRLDGSEDPHAELAEAQAHLEAAVARLESVRRRAEAVRLVCDLFEEERRALSERFSRPLAEKITEYLRRLFGPDSRAEVIFVGSTFTGVQLSRSQDEGALDFERLSEGTKEQVAAAVRLAVAELLAADHDGTLPVVFDDAFAYSDPERVRSLQGMLDQAARQGLQVIVLTCDPWRYATLGASRIDLGTD